MQGSKQCAKESWRRGRGRNSLHGEVKFSIKKNKRYLTRKARRHKDVLNGCSYKKLAKDKAWEYVT